MTTFSVTEDTRAKTVQLITGNLRVLFKSIQLHSRKMEKTCGLTCAMLWMMWELFANPGMKVSELARILSIHASTCSNMLDKLESKGLVERNRSIKDQRAVHLFLTDAGQKMLAKAPRPAQGAMSEALEELRDHDLDNLAGGLNALVAALQVKEQNAEFVPMFE